MKKYKSTWKNQYPKAVKFTIISHLSQTYSMKTLLHLAEVSSSGYYKHKKLIRTHTTKPEREKSDVKIIQKIALKYKRRYGYRMITIKLKQAWIIMNHKKVLKIMKKYHLLSKIRKRNPYKHIQKATQEHRVCKNILNRKFWGLQAFKKYWTDISYLYYGNGQKAYLSILKDMVSWEIVSHTVSSSLALDFVLQMMKKTAKKKLKKSIIHSDQWWHYTHPEYQRLLKENKSIQSMSRKGNCLDNAPTESFFWHMKDEVKQDIKQIPTFKELEKYINTYILYYNNKRPQWNKKKMTPVQYRNHLLTNNSN